MTSREPWQPHIERQSEFNPFDTTPKDNAPNRASKIRNAEEDTAPLQGSKDLSDADSLEDVIADAYQKPQ
jgi:hypothetical protein